MVQRSTIKGTASAFANLALSKLAFAAAELLSLRAPRIPLHNAPDVGLLGSPIGVGAAGPFVWDGDHIPADAPAHKPGGRHRGEEQYV